MAVEKTIIINADSQDAVKNISQLETKIEELTNKVKSADFGTKEFDEASAELVKYNRELKNVDLAMESLDTEQMTAAFGGMIGGIAGAATAYTGLAVSLGVSQEAADKNVEKLLALLSITEGVGAVTQGLSDAKKFFNNITKTELVLKAKNIALMVASKVALVASTVATGAVTAAQWLWNAAMTANPIGLIIVGVSALIAGIYLLVTNISSVVDWFQEMGTKLLWLAAGPIGWMIFGYQALAEENTKSTKTQAENIKELSAENTKAYNNKLDEIQKETDARKKAFNDQNEVFDLEIERLEAEGKSTKQLLIDKAQARLDETQAISDDFKKRLEAAKVYYQQQRALSGVSEEEFNKQLLRRGINVVEIEAKFNSKIAQLDKQLYSDKSKLIKAQNNLKNELNKKTVNNTKEVVKDTKDTVEKVAEVIGGTPIPAISLRVESPPDDKIKESSAVIVKTLKNRIDDAILASRGDSTAEGKTKSFIGSLFELSSEETDFIFAQAAQIGSELANLAKEQHEQELQSRKDRLEQSSEQENNILKTKLEKGLITQREFDLESDKLEKSKQRRLKEIERKEFRRQKKISIGKAIISGAQASLDGIAQFGPPPSPMGIFALASAAAVTALQVAQIKKQKFTAASGGIVPGANSTVDNVPSLLAGGETVINANSSSLFPGLLNDINQAGGGKDLGTGTSSNNQVVKAVVVETDITETQDKINRYKSISEF